MPKKHSRRGSSRKGKSQSAKGITHLKTSIAEGKKKNATAATGHAELALTHLEQAQ
jgi:hypothetical protein